MPSIDEAIGELLATDRPVLFLDTCVLLDVIRSTHRCLKGCAEAAWHLAKLLSATPPVCSLVVSLLVPKEWRDNVHGVTDETIRHLRRMEEQASHFDDACRALRIAVASPPTAYGRCGLAEALRDRSQSLIDQAVRLDEDPGCRVRAVERVVARVPPALKGQVKDSAIIEEYLAVCRGLRAAGFSRRRVYCTSNTADYCEASGSLHASLAVEFASQSLIFTTQLPWALREVRS